MSRLILIAILLLTSCATPPGYCDHHRQWCFLLHDITTLP